MLTRQLSIVLPFILIAAQPVFCHAEEPPKMPVVQPVQRQVTDFQDFNGRAEAAAAVTIKARVTGYLSRVAFKDGADVKQGDVLFEIDPRPYQAALNQATSEAALYEASLRLAKSNYERDTGLSERAPGVIPQKQIEQDKAAVDEATARVRAAQASVESARLNLDFTRITSPINGRIGRRFLDAGNLVKADDTALATVVSLDPIYVYFDMDEVTFLRIRRALNEGKIKPSTESLLLMGLADEAAFPHKGAVDFVNNQVNANTGAITVRGVFPNPKPAPGEPLLIPGMFLRLRLTIGQPHAALLVPEQAVGTDQGTKFVYVIDAENKARRRQVKVGAVESDGLCVIIEGLKPDDRVAIGGFKQLKEGTLVSPKQAELPGNKTEKE